MRFYIVSSYGYNPQYFKTREDAEEYLLRIGARKDKRGQWYTVDGDGDVDTEYDIKEIVTREGKNE